MPLLSGHTPPGIGRLLPWAVLPSRLKGRGRKAVGKWPGGCGAPCRGRCGLWLRRPGRKGHREGVERQGEKGETGGEDHSVFIQMSLLLAAAAVAHAGRAQACRRNIRSARAHHKLRPATRRLQPPQPAPPAGWCRTSLQHKATLLRPAGCRRRAPAARYMSSCALQEGGSTAAAQAPAAAGTPMAAAGNPAAVRLAAAAGAAARLSPRCGSRRQGSP